MLATQIVYNSQPSLPSSHTSSSRSSGAPFPFRQLIASDTSRELPTACPRGASMFVRTALAEIPSPRQELIISWAKEKAFSWGSPPRPHFTSTTRNFMFSVSAQAGICVSCKCVHRYSVMGLPSNSSSICGTVKGMDNFWNHIMEIYICTHSPAAFLDTMELAMSGMEWTVPVTSRMLYSLLSAGASVSLWFTIQQPTLDTTSRICFIPRLMLNPGIDSSLSRVPPS